MDTISLKLPRELAIRLESVAKQRRMTKSALVRDALAAYLANGNEPLPGSFGDLAREFIGCVEGPGDLSYNPKYMEGFGS